MLGVDTNVLVRYLAGDDRSKYERARRLIHREEDIGEPVLVSLLVLLEMEWVLRSRYGLRANVDLELSGSRFIRNIGDPVTKGLAENSVSRDNRKGQK
jgi:predicted nucleic acid-binding protein